MKWNIFFFLSTELKYVEEKDFLQISAEVAEIRKMLTAFARTIRKSSE